jgi:thymidine kinase
MRYGRLEVICGPMFAGKSTEILKKVLWDRHKGLSVLVIKPSFDNRFSETRVVSHDGLSSDAKSIGAWDADYLFGAERNYPSKVYIDEVQFFQKPSFNGDLVFEVQNLLENGVDVMVSGLDTDWMGNPFQTTAMLAAMADEVRKVTANCTVCGRPATKNYKKTGAGASVELGASDLYEARCNEHWRWASATGASGEE